MNAKVLVVHGDRDIIQRVRDTLEPHGYQIQTAATAAEALQSVASLQPRLILLSSILPDMSYFRFMKELGGERSTTRPRVLVLTDPGDMDHGGLHEFDTGPDMFLTEQFVPAELLAYVRRLLGTNKSGTASDAVL